MQVFATLPYLIATSLSDQSVTAAAASEKKNRKIFVRIRLKTRSHKSQVAVTVAVDCNSRGDGKFPISLQKRNRLSQVAADSQCNVNQP